MSRGREAPVSLQQANRHKSFSPYPERASFVDPFKGRLLRDTAMRKDVESRLPYWVRVLCDIEEKVKAEAAAGREEDGNVSF